MSPNPLFLLPKTHPDLPDGYELKIHYLTGKVETYQVASHAIVKEWNALEFVTRDDLWSLVPMNSVARFEFDKDWSKTREIRIQEEIKRQKEEAQKGLQKSAH